MLQAVLTGKAQVAYSSMSAEESASYDKVKQAILKAYELVPEAYRQKFRDLRKIQGQTYMDFAKQKERLFEEWCKSLFLLLSLPLLLILLLLLLLSYYCKNYFCSLMYFFIFLYSQINAEFTYVGFHY